MRQIILLSYPHSGNTWVRYIIEHCFNIRTKYDEKTHKHRINGNIRHLINGYGGYKKNIVVIKKHFDLNGVYARAKLIRIDRKDVHPIVKAKWGRRLMKEINTWYAKWRGPKITISYQNAVNNTEIIISQLSIFLKIPPINKDEFIENIEYHRKKCLDLYVKESDETIHTLTNN